MLDFTRILAQSPKSLHLPAQIVKIDANVRGETIAMSDPSSPLSSSTHKAKMPSKSSRKPRFARLRRWLRSRAGRIIIPLVALFLGIVVGVVSLLLYGLSGDGQALPVPGPGKTDISVVADKAFITSLITSKLRQSGLPGTVQNIQVDLAGGDQLTIDGDDGFNVMGIGFTKHFTVVVQPYISNCSLQIHVTHADLNSIPVTGFVSTFESIVNQQFQQKPTSLPQGFQYCATSVSTQPAGILLTYSAIPV
jgi:hypothetical protein